MDWRTGINPGTTFRVDELWLGREDGGKKLSRSENMGVSTHRVKTFKCQRHGPGFCTPLGGALGLQGGLRGAQVSSWNGPVRRFASRQNASMRLTGKAPEERTGITAQSRTAGVETLQCGMGTGSINV